jgi:hypothetical protein
MNSSPSFIATEVVELPEKDQGINQAIVRIYPGRLDRTKRDPARFKRRQAVLIVNADTSAETLRFVMGASHGGVKKNAVSLDYDAIDALGISFKQSVTLKVRPATKYEILRHYLEHPDMSIQVAMRLALWGITLGVFGAVCGIVSVIAVFG